MNGVIGGGHRGPRVAGDRGDRAQRKDPALHKAAAVTVYLAHRRDEIDSGPDTLLHLAARAEFDGEPPRTLAEWLQAAGIEY